MTGTSVSSVPIDGDIDAWKWLFDLQFVGDFLVKHPPAGADVTWKLELYENENETPTEEWEARVGLVEADTEHVGVKVAFIRTNGTYGFQTKGSTGLEVLSQTYSEGTSIDGGANIASLFPFSTRVIKEPLSVQEKEEKYVLAYWAEPNTETFRPFPHDLSAKVEVGNLVQWLQQNGYGRVRVLTMTLEDSEWDSLAVDE